jgi:hypothetical protein
MPSRICDLFQRRGYSFKAVMDDGETGTQFIGKEVHVSSRASLGQLVKAIEKVDKLTSSPAPQPISFAPIPLVGPTEQSE